MKITVNSKLRRSLKLSHHITSCVFFSSDVVTRVFTKIGTVFPKANSMIGSGHPHNEKFQTKKKYCHNMGLQLT